MGGVAWCWVGDHEGWRSVALADYVGEEKRMPTMEGKKRKGERKEGREEKWSEKESEEEIYKKNEKKQRTVSYYSLLYLLINLPLCLC